MRQRAQRRPSGSRPTWHRSSTRVSQRTREVSARRRLDAELVRRGLAASRTEAQRLIGEGLAPSTYVAAQGAALGRAGRVHVQRVGADVWIGGDVVSVVSGTVAL